MTPGRKGGPGAGGQIVATGALVVKLRRGGALVTVTVRFTRPDRSVVW
jgi:hypothetical protein